ncbi:MAG: acyltransferase [Muribaculaceae bacterium]|nr:acyltransferase [Muribaculaceae bacterium]
MSERKSNMEALRILSMLMVLTVHIDGASLGLPSAPGTDIGAREAWKLAVEAAAITGVNCFTMISGYFGIRLRFRSIASFLFQCVFYSVGVYSLGMLLWPGLTSAEGWTRSWLVLTYTDLWYVPAYFCLMLLAPVLNPGLEALSRRRFAIVLALFALFTFWCGWWRGGRFNPTGYTVMQLVFVYMTARYVRLHVSATFLRRHRLLWAALFAAATAGIFLTSLWLPFTKAFAYNSPLVMAATVALFFLFTTSDFRSRAVNYAARSAFAAYLLHKAPLVWNNLMRPAVTDLWDSMTLTQFTLAAAVLALGIYLAAMAVDAIRRLIWDTLSKSITINLTDK